MGIDEERCAKAQAWHRWIVDYFFPNRPGRSEEMDRAIGNRLVEATKQLAGLGVHVYHDVDRGKLQALVTATGALVYEFDWPIVTAPPIPIDSSKGEWRCFCPSFPNFDPSANPAFVRACRRCGATRPGR